MNLLSMLLSLLLKEGRVTVMMIEHVTGTLIHWKSKIADTGIELAT